MEYALSIEQINFEADDSRCNEQKIDSFSSLVNYDTEFSNQASSAIKNGQSM